MSEVNNRSSSSSLSMLPTEILLLIFDYLTSNDILFSFFHCNQRLNNILLTRTYHFITPRRNLEFWNEILPIIGSQIETLIININYLTVSLDYFSNLTSMIICSPYFLLTKQLEIILNHQCFQNLHTLKIKNAIQSLESYNSIFYDNERILFKKIFDHGNQIKVFEYLPPLPSGNIYSRDLHRLDSNIHIRSLKLNLTYFSYIFILLSNTPNLIYLNVQLRATSIRFEEYESMIAKKIKLEEFHLKLKPWDDETKPRSFSLVNPYELFDVIRSFSSSLITLSLNFADVGPIDYKDDLINGDQLENRLLKFMNKLRNFYLYVHFQPCENIEEILSRFQTQFWIEHQWSFGVHQNTYLYSLPFVFQELRHFQNFEKILSNNDTILKHHHHHRLWSNVKSIELIHIDQVDFKNLFPLIKINMPKLLSMTFSGNSWNEIECINNELNSVTTVRLKDISMEQIQPILIYSFSNLRYLILDHTELPSTENQLTLFINEKIQRIETDEFSLRENDFSYLSNLQHLRLICGLILDKKWLSNRSRMIHKLLTKLRKLETLTIYAIPNDGYVIHKPDTILRPIMDRLNKKQIKTLYDIRYAGQYIWFIKKIASCS